MTEEAWSESDVTLLRQRLDEVVDGLPFEVTCRSMMGGFVAYADGVVFASLSRGGLGLKLQGPARQALLAVAGARPHRHGPDEPPSKTYVRLPEEQLHDDDALIGWLVAAAHDARALPRRRRPDRSTRTAP